MSIYFVINRTNEFTNANDSDKSTRVTTRSKLGELTIKEKQKYHNTLSNEKFILLTDILPCKCEYIKCLGGTASCIVCELTNKRDKVIKKTSKR